MKQWFEAHRHELPQTLQIDEATYTPDLPFTVESLFMQVDSTITNPNMQTNFLLMQRIRNKLEKGNPS